MRIRPCHGLGETLSKAIINCKDQVRSDVVSDAETVSRMFASLIHPQTMVKTASKSDLHFYVDPRLAEKYKINLHLIDTDVQASTEDGGRVISADKKNSDFIEETVTFASKRQYEPNYICTIVFQKPDDQVYSVSAYLMETYLGRYAYKSNYYFRKDSRAAAQRCFSRVITAVKDIRQDFMERDLKQNEVPYHLRRALQGEAGEVEPKSNGVATYLDPKNVAKKTTIGSENIITIPSRRSIKDDLRLEE